MVARGHEFHYSEIARMDETLQIYTGTDRAGQASTAEGFLAGNVLGSYVHPSFRQQSRHRPPVCCRLPDIKGAIVMTTAWNLPPQDIENQSFAIIDHEASP